MTPIRRRQGAEPAQVWRAADAGGPPAAPGQQDPAPVFLRRRQWVIAGLTLLTAVLLALIFMVSELLMRGLFAVTGAVLVLLAAFLAVANPPTANPPASGPPARKAPEAPQPPQAARGSARHKGGSPGGAAAPAVRPEVEVQGVETTAGPPPAAGEQQPPEPLPPHSYGPQARPMRPHAQLPAPLPAPLPVPLPAPPEERRPARALPAADRPEEPGRFPVLLKPSRLATAPWRLPAAPSAAGITADEAVLGGLQLRAASVSGPSHRSRGIPRQDAYRIGQDSAGRHLLVAVADGMSDSAHSDIGAGAAVIALVSTLRDLLDRGVPPAAIDVREVFLSAARQMYGAADQRGWTADEVRAVALAAVVPAQPDPDGVRRCWLGAVGDVSAWRLVRERWERLIGDEKGGLDPSAVSHFLPHHYDHLPYGVVELGPGEVMALTSDGVADAFAFGPSAQGWFAERWRQPPPVGAFLLHVGFEQAQLQDDRTAVVVWCADTAGTLAQGGRP